MDPRPRARCRSIASRRQTLGAALCLLTACLTPGCLTDGLDGRLFACTDDDDCGSDWFCARSHCRPDAERGRYCDGVSDCAAGATCNIDGECVGGMPGDASDTTDTTDATDSGDTSDTMSPVQCTDTCDEGWAACLTGDCPADCQCEPVLRVSVDSAGQEGDRSSAPTVAVSGDGRFVAFASDADNLVGGDTNAVSDVFVYDLQTRATERISVASDGTEADGQSLNPSMSADGRFVVFQSDATNLVADDTNQVTDVFLADRQAGTVERISGDATGAQHGGRSWHPVISADGQVVVYEQHRRSPTGNPDEWSLVVLDRTVGAGSAIVARADGLGDRLASVSGDGSRIAFATSTPDLDPELPDTNGVSDVFVFERGSPGTLVRLSVDRSTGSPQEGDGASESPIISADGRFVAFVTRATNLVPETASGAFDPQIVRVEVDAPSEFVLVTTTWDGFADQDDPNPHLGGISSDGRYLVFESASPWLIAGGLTDSNNWEDVYLFDAQAAANGDYPRTRLSESRREGQTTDASLAPALSLDGSVAAFASLTRNLVPGDTNNATDVFVADTGVTELAPDRINP